MAELFVSSAQTISYHIANMLKKGELENFSVVKESLTTADDEMQNFFLKIIYYVLKKWLILQHK